MAILLSMVVLGCATVVIVVFIVNIVVMGSAFWKGVMDSYRPCRYCGCGPTAGQVDFSCSCMCHD